MKLRAVLLTVLFVAFLLVADKTFAQTISENIDATIKISICGNEIKEGGEDCDNFDMNEATCTSVGFGSGELDCDISCSFDTSSCIEATSTPSASVSTSQSSESSNSLVGTSTPGPTAQPIIVSQAALPDVLRFFDISGTGRILRENLREIVELWVNDWKRLGTENKNCDTNEDGICNLYDFSVLMFYVDR